MWLVFSFERTLILTNLCTSNFMKHSISLINLYFINMCIVLKDSATRALPKSLHWLRKHTHTHTQMNNWQRATCSYNSTRPKLIFFFFNFDGSKRSFSMPPQFFLFHFPPGKWASGTFQVDSGEPLWILDPYCLA